MKSDLRNISNQNITRFTALILSFILYMPLIHSQTPQDNLKKYWYYRYRLQNDFLKIGPDCGESIPGDIRDKRDVAPGTMDWGDATIHQGWYLGVLATEYKLLKDNGQDVSQTAKEQYYALKV